MRCLSAASFFFFFFASIWIACANANPVPYRDFHAASFGVQRWDDGYLREVERMRAEGVAEVCIFPFTAGCLCLHK